MDRWVEFLVSENIFLWEETVVFLFQVFSVKLRGFYPLLCLSLAVESKTDHTTSL